MDEQSIIISNQFMPAMGIEDARKRRNAVVEFVKAAMVKGTDFGVIPGTGDKPTLLKPGAEKLCTLFGFSNRFICTLNIEDWSGDEHGGEPLFYYSYKCQLYRGDFLIAEGEGSCNSHEKKYRYRQGERKCPKCGRSTIIKGKAEYGGGWLCFGKKGGCGEKFLEDDRTITDQSVGQILNPDIADQVNTIQKMAQKRALVAATLLAVNASEFFTQDIEDMAIDSDFSVVDQKHEQSTATPMQVVNMNSNGKEPTVVTNKPHQKIAAIRHKPFITWAQEWTSKHIKYLKNGNPDLNHVMARVALLGFSEVTESNMGDVQAALDAYVRGNVDTATEST